jgi:hypothetical protein
MCMHLTGLSTSKSRDKFWTPGKNSGWKQQILPPLGGYSQDFVRQILKIFVNLGLNILRFYKPKVFFKANINKV